MDAAIGKSKVDLYRDRTVVGAEDLIMDFGAFQSVLKVIGYYEVVDSPSDVLLSCLEPI